jgi:hypothetical protein
MEKMETDVNRIDKYSVHNIILDYIKSNGYDGLWNPKTGCACWHDDLAPGSMTCEGLKGCYPAFILSDGVGNYYGSFDPRKVNFKTPNKEMKK